MILIKRKNKPGFILTRKSYEDLAFSDAPAYFITSNNYSVSEYNLNFSSDEDEKRWLSKIDGFLLEPNNQIYFLLEESKRLTKSQEENIIKIFNSNFNGFKEEEFQKMEFEVQGDTAQEMISQLESVLKLKRLLRIN